jgi:hypothetical protein
MATSDRDGDRDRPFVPVERMRVLVDDLIYTAARCAEMTSMVSVASDKFSSLLDYMKVN